MKFSDLGLSDDVLRAVADAGYTEPTPIQKQAIPVILMGRDVLGCAQTGTGKTAGFTLPMIDILASGRAKARMPRSLIVEPTRELAAQVAVNFETYGKYTNLSKALLTGGSSLTEQQRLLGRGVDVLIATPGRLLDLFDRGKILLSDCKVLVIDEADRMLDMGFIPDVERIVSYLPKIRQTLFFSATFPPELRRLADNFLINPKEIHVTPPASPAETVDHFLVSAGAKEKRAVLRRLLRREPVQNALIFCNRKRDVDILARSLERHGFSAAALHGDMPQPVRTETLEAFKNGEIIELVATDVAGRGLDIEGLSHVFNFDVPTHAEDYVHRIGRTGRAGRRGRAITLSTPEERKFLGAITALIGKDIPLLEVPDLVASDGQEGAAEIQPRRKATNRNGPQRKQKGRREKARKASSKTGERGADPRADGAGRERETAQRKPGKPDNGPRRGRVVGLGDHVPAFLLRPGRTGTGKG